LFVFRRYISFFTKARSDVLSRKKTAHFKGFIFDLWESFAKNVCFDKVQNVPKKERAVPFSFSLLFHFKKCSPKITFLKVQVDPGGVPKPKLVIQFYEGISIQIGASWPAPPKFYVPAPSLHFAALCLCFAPPKGRHLCIAITS
jgi:hypothetical protein